MDTSSSFGDVLRELRNQRHVSQRELGRRLGGDRRSVHRNTILHWERGDVLPNRAAVAEIIKALALSGAEEDLLLETYSGIRRLPRLHNLPMWRNPYFTGREDLLQHLHDQLGPGSQVALTHALSGLGGIGKTEVALEYAYRHEKDYRHIFWATVDSQETFITEFCKLARDLDLPEKNAKDQHRVVQAVQRWLREYPDWLLILDNVEDLHLVTSFIPPGCVGAVLLTTRMQVTAPITSALLQNMPAEEGAVLLLRRAERLAPHEPLDAASPDERFHAEAIARMLGGLPLAIDQAGAYILEGAKALGDYRALYTERHTALLAKRGSAPSTHPESVTTTFSLAFERLQQKNAAAAELLRLCAFLDPDAIPEALITAGAETHLGPALASVVRDTIAFDGVIEALRSLSLIQRNASKAALITAEDDTDLDYMLTAVLRDYTAANFDSIPFAPGEVSQTLTFQREDVHRRASTHELGVHRLVQAVLADQMSAAVQRDWIECCIRLLDLAFPSEISVWEAWADTWLDRLNPHVLRIVGLKAAWEAAPTEAASLFENTARYFFLRGREGEAESLYQYVLRIRQQTLGADHPDTVTALKNLWLVQHYHETGHPTYPF